MTSAPQAESKQLLGEYKDRYVAFLDLLGFKEQVLKAETDPDELQSYTTCSGSFAIRLAAILISDFA
jgi:hypothetical protein